MTGEESELTQEQALELMGHLDRGTSIFGKLDPDIRSRLYAVAENPTETTWNDAYGIMINNETFTTLWQACNKHSGYDVEWLPETPTTMDEILDQRPRRAAWPVIPTRQQILTALRGELRRKPPHHHEAWQIQDSAKGGRYCAACGEELCGNPYPAMSGERARFCLRPVDHEGAHRNNGDVWREQNSEGN